VVLGASYGAYLRVSVIRFDYAARKTDLTSEETEHLQECDDCRDEVMALRRLVQDSADVDKTRHFLAEEGKLPLVPEPPKEIHEAQRELDETPGS